MLAYYIVMHRVVTECIILFNVEDIFRLRSFINLMQFEYLISYANWQYYKVWQYYNNNWYAQACWVGSKYCFKVVLQLKLASVLDFAYLRRFKFNGWWVLFLEMLSALSLLPSLLCTTETSESSCVTTISPLIFISILLSLPSSTEQAES